MNLDAVTRPALLQHQSDSGEYLGLGEKYSDFIIVSNQPFTQRNLDRFGATWLLKHSKKVHLIDLSLIVWGEAAARDHESNDAEGVLRATSWYEVDSFLQQHGDQSLVIPHVAPYIAISLFRLTENYSLPTLYCEPGRGMPTSKSFLKLLASSARALSNPTGLFRRIRNRQRHDEILIDYFIATGKDPKGRTHPWEKRSRQIIPSHSYDYVVWQTVAPLTSSDPYVVFLDQAYPDHPDFVKVLGFNPFTRESYYPRIESLLRHVSDGFGMPVFIALHPRSSDAEPKPYQGFQTFLGRTASLVKGARLVIAHDSTAVSFAVLGRKPLLLVEVDERSKRPYIGNVTRNVSAILGAPVIHMSDRTLLPLDKFAVDESKYAHYEESYIRHPACNGIPLWDRVFGRF